MVVRFATNILEIMIAYFQLKLNCLVGFYLNVKNLIQIGRVKLINAVKIISPLDFCCLINLIFFAEFWNSKYRVPTCLENDFIYIKEIVRKSIRYIQFLELNYKYF